MTRYQNATKGNAALQVAAPHLRLVATKENPCKVYHFEEASRRKTHTQETKQPITFQQAFVIGVAIASILLFALFLGDLKSSRTVAQLDQMPTEIVTVKSGDTLWHLAQTHGVESVTTSDMVEWIVATNALSSSSLVPGQKLVVPVH